MSTSQAPALSSMNINKETSGRRRVSVCERERERVRVSAVNHRIRFFLLFYSS